MKTENSLQIYTEITCVFDVIQIMSVNIWQKVDYLLEHNKGQKMVYIY